jgi:hypothetical protein
MPADVSVASIQGTRQLLRAHMEPQTHLSSQTSLQASKPEHVSPLHWKLSARVSSHAKAASSAISAERILILLPPFTKPSTVC